MDEGLVIAFAVPVFFALIVAEALVARARGHRTYRLSEAIACLSCGIGQQAVGLLIRAIPVLLYAAAFHTLALWQLDPSSPWVWLVGLIAVDHQYYWWHRLSHRVRILWASHKVHHQSEDYNLAVALRQEWFGAFTHLPFQLPLAVLGIPVEVWLISELVNLLYQFWIHTEEIDRLPAPLEAVLNTPSHHRVHHGVDPIYIDKNHGGILILWDRLYGTFTPEAHRPTYGTVTPLRSVNPIWADLEPFVEIHKELRAMPTWSDRLRHLVAPPEHYPDCLGGPKAPQTPTPGRRSLDVSLTPGLAAYVSVHFGLIALALTLLLALGADLSLPALGGATLWILVSTGSLAGIMEGRPWALPAESLRLIAAIPLLGMWLAPPWLAVAAAGILASAVWASRLGDAPRVSPEHARS